MTFIDYYLGSYYCLGIRFLPFLSFLVLAIIGKRLGWYLSVVFSVSCILMSLVCTTIMAIILSYETWEEAILFDSNLVWFRIGNLFRVEWSGLLDSLSITMLFVVLLISLFVHIYSVGYMGADPNRIRFMSYLSLFTFFMIMLVTAANFLVMFVGWEGVGLCSFLLINFWHTRWQARKSATQAIIMNRIGDAAIIIAMLVLAIQFGSLDYTVIFNSITFYYWDWVPFGFTVLSTCFIVALFLFIGAMAKSAQLGLHTWLPTAMEGPTPVSALIHAATMVTAGIFLIVRCSQIFEYAFLSYFGNDVLIFILLIGALTSFFGGIVGMVQNDIKKVIAYSTCSQLGYMVVACGLSNYALSMFHLTNHAFFKALLFLGAGSVIHAVENEQDMRRIGGLLNSLPVTYITIMIGSLALMGVPFFTGFYSKDIILESSALFLDGSFSYLLGMVTVFCTAFYSIRLIYMVFLGQTSISSGFGFRRVHESSFPILFPLIILAICSLFVGYILRDIFIGLGTPIWGHPLPVYDNALVREGVFANFYQNMVFIPMNSINLISEFSPMYIKFLPTFLTIFGAIWAKILYSNINVAYENSNISYFLSTLLMNSNVGRIGYSFIVKAWYIDEIYNFFFASPIMGFGFRYSFRTIDQGVLNYFGPIGIVKFIRYCVISVNQLQSGFIYHYIYLMFLGCLSYIIFFYFTSILAIQFSFHILILFIFFLFYITTNYFSDLSR